MRPSLRWFTTLCAAAVLVACVVAAPARASTLCSRQTGTPTGSFRACVGYNGVNVNGTGEFVSSTSFYLVVALYESGSTPHVVKRVPTCPNLNACSTFLPDPGGHAFISTDLYSPIVGHAYYTCAYYTRDVTFQTYQRVCSPSFQF